MMYGQSQYFPLTYEADKHEEWRSSRGMEFTKLNTSADHSNTEGDWHMVTAPRSVFKGGGAVKRENQQDPLEREFYNSLPRAHFLRPGYFRTATESSTFSPYSHDLYFKGKRLQDQSPRDSESYGCIPPSSRPHPLAQPGFYSPKIPRSKHCEPALSTTKTQAGCSPNYKMKEFYSHTLPLPHSKKAVLNQSGLCSQPQGLKTSVVEKPRLMRAVISQIPSDSSQLNQQQYDHNFQPIQKQELPGQCLSNQCQSSVNHPSPEDSRKEDFMWNHRGKPETNKFQCTQNRSSFRMLQHAQDNYEINTSFGRPQYQPKEQANMRLNLRSSCYCKLRLYSDNCIHNTQDSEDCLLHRSMAQPINNPKDLWKKKYDVKVRKDGSDVENNTSNNMSQVNMSSRNVFGQPRVVATLRATCSPRPVRKTTVVEDLKKLIVMDDIIEPSQRDSPSLQQTRMNSSLSEFIQDSASSSPVLSRHALSRPRNLTLHSNPSEGQPVSAESAWDRDIQFDHELLSLPKTAPDIDWNSLVNAAEAYEMQTMANIPHNILSGKSPSPHSPAYSGQDIPRISPTVSVDTDDEVFTDFPDQLSHLEVVLRRLSRDLLKEKEDKVALLAEVLKLRMSNQHLKEESLSANAQLHKICQIFNISMYGVEDETK
ncbi:uncharacterized protein [Hoplias malabaricus]|uniref:uncharacterized protein n=1 Tax=Hoplias malabaricus TaxID=27720 RepID=UPI0034632183